MLRPTTIALTLSLVFGSTVESFAQEKPAQKTAPRVDAQPVKGTFVIGGKSYSLTHAVAYEAKVFDDYMINVLASSEPIAVDKLKNALRDGKGSDDKFITFQPQVKLTFKKTGEIRFCNSNADGHSFSVSGGDLAGELVTNDGHVIGDASYKSEEGSKRPASFDVKFDLELIAAMLTPDDKPKKNKSKLSGDGKPESDSGPAGPKKGKVTADSFNAFDLPIPDDATAIERKMNVEHVYFKSPSDVKVVTEFLVKQFDAQGWSKEGKDLDGKKAMILKRKKGSSSLTIFVKPGESGSSVTMITKGLSWEDRKPVSDKKSSPKPEKNE